ncbi:Uncharacterised protein [uncultured archaeon]|nr:Uncharacterised protein [uncultured archaeon]
MFELNFNDNRYLPFEGAGAISDWKLQLSGKWKNEGDIVDLAQFDFSTISDVILHIKYTAKDGHESLKGKALKSLIDLVSTEEQLRIFSAKHEFPDEWYKFLQQTAGASESQKMKLDFSPGRFPFKSPNWEIEIDSLDIYLDIKESSELKSTIVVGITNSGGSQSGNVNPTPPPELKNLPNCNIKFMGYASESEPWFLTADITGQKDIIQDILIGCHYKLIKAINQ